MVTVVSVKYLNEVNGFLNSGSYTTENFNRVKQEIARQDILKGININDYMPEVSYLL